MRKAIKSGEAGISWDNHGRLTDLDYADDIALLAESDSRLQEATSSLNQEATKSGLRISAEKSKIMKIGIEHTPININVGTTQLENVTKFTYLGSTVSYDGDADIDIRTRIAKAAAVFRRLQPLLATTSISNNIKLRLYLSIVVPTAIYTSETWKMCASAIKKINVFHLGCLRRIMKIRYVDHVTNEEVLRRSSTTSLHVIIAQRRLRLAGHILRMPQQRIPHGAMSWTPPDGKRSGCRPRNTWRRTFVNDLKLMNISREEGEVLEQDRQRWREFVARCAQQHRRN
ncbi:hypothetical protein Y032_0097g3004 [Ancylostoma ceylanicum]|uniref:Reverse transcriptase domain-containing protein n=1 Tax=Ancylostoma ceylanicum TaxID=53326 RepID=A0A016TJP0_9BILA|nr:hypothetical protein Y032_0097g3004 [Ancylostoma ceylanicum]